MKILEKNPLVEMVIMQNKKPNKELMNLEKLAEKAIKNSTKDISKEELEDIIVELTKYKIELESLLICMLISMPKNDG